MPGFGGTVDLAALACPVAILRPVPRQKRAAVPWMGNAAGAGASQEAAEAAADDGSVPVARAAPAAAAGLGSSSSAAIPGAADAALEAQQAQSSANADPLAELTKEQESVVAESAAAASQGDAKAASDGDVAMPPAPSDDAKVSAGAGGVESAASAFLAQAIERHHIFLTSPPGVGKTTMVQRLIAQLQKDEGAAVEIAGFYTEEVRDRAGQRSGFDLVKVGDDDRQGPPRDALARIGQEQPKVGKYTVDVKSLENFALPLLRPPPKAPPRPDNPRLYTALDGSVECVDLLRDAEVPNREEEDSGGPEVPEPEKKQEVFIPAWRWEGSKPGYFFTTGVSGLGYYLDRPFGSWMADEEKDERGAKKKVEKDDTEYCLIYLPSSGLQAYVEPSTLAPLPEGWRDPREEQEERRRLRPRLVICDEVGKMGLLSLKFPHALNEAMDDEGSVLLGTLPQPAKGQRDHEVVEKIKRRPNVKITRVSRNNRDSEVPKVYAALRESLGLGAVGSERRKTAYEIEEERKAAEAAKKAAEEEEKRRQEEQKTQQLDAVRKKEKEAKAKKMARIKKKNAMRAREERKARAQIRERVRAVVRARREGPMDIAEEDEDSVEALAAEVALDEDGDDDDLLSDGSDVFVGAATPAPCSADVDDIDVEDCAAAVEAVSEILDVEGAARLGRVGAGPKPMVGRPGLAPVAGAGLVAGRVAGVAAAAAAANGRRRRPAAGGATVLLDEDEVL